MGKKRLSYSLMVLATILISCMVLSSCTEHTDPTSNKWSRTGSISHAEQSSDRSQAQEIKQPTETPVPSPTHSLSLAQSPSPSTPPSFDPSPKSTTTPSISPNVLPKPAQKKQVKVKGIYVPSGVALGSRMDQVQSMMESSGLNAVVLDAKNDFGYSGSNEKMAALLGRLKKKGIYCIARIVVFKDPHLAESQPELAMQAKSGEVWRDRKGVSWVDPYKKQVWIYNLNIAKQAAVSGFDEIQFDYVRFPENGKTVDAEVNFDNPEGWSKAQAITAFLSKAKSELAPYGVQISADVFGLTTSSTNDMGIGQKWELMAPNVDAICPMIYPSHYSKGMFGTSMPDLQPYSIVRRSLQDALARNRTLRNQPMIRPWLQDFTATWVQPHQQYGTLQVKEQIKAASELGVDQFLLWNARGSYSFR